MVTHKNEIVTGDNESVTGDKESVTGDNESFTSDNDSVSGDNKSVTEGGGKGCGAQKHCSQKEMDRMDPCRIGLFIQLLQMDPIR